MEKRPWWPKIETYPTLVLDDHATEWASRIADAEERIEVGGEELEPTSVPASLSSEKLGNTVGMRATQPPKPRNGGASEDYVPERVWSGDVSSGLC